MLNVLKGFSAVGIAELFVVNIISNFLSYSNFTSLLRAL